MALEGEVVFGVGGVDVLDGHPTLNAAQSKPRRQARLLVQAVSYTHLTLPTSGRV